MTKTKNKKTGNFNTITSCISTALVLILLGTATFFVKLAENFGRELRENFTVEVLLDDEAALESYQNDPYHCSVVKKHMHAVREASVAVDYVF